jgi:hypothetical protein
LDEHLDGLESIFDKYRQKLEQICSEALSGSHLTTVRRRQVLQKQMQEKIEQNTHALVVQLQEMQGIEQSSDAGHSMYKTLKDTFNAFDRDGSAEMQYPVTHFFCMPRPGSFWSFSQYSPELGNLFFFKNIKFLQ